MNNRRISSVLVVMLLLGAVAFTGCATVSKKSGVEMAEQTTASMQDVDSDMKQASLQIDTVNSSLNDLVMTGQNPSSQPSDVKRSFDAYKDNIAKMDDTGKSLNKHIDQMNSRGNDYFEEWAKEGGSYTSPNIQKLSEERRVRLRGAFTDIASSSAGMRGSLNAYLSELKQIETYLSNDLSPKGISAITSTAMAAQRDGNSLKASFSPVQTAIAKARTEMMPGGTAAGGTTMEQSDQFKPMQTP